MEQEELFQDSVDFYYEFRHVDKRYDNVFGDYYQAAPTVYRPGDRGAPWNVVY